LTSLPRERGEFRGSCSCRDDARSSTRVSGGEEASGGKEEGAGPGSGLSACGDEGRPHPPRFIDRVTPLAGVLANFPPYLRSPSRRAPPSPLSVRTFFLSRGRLEFRRFRRDLEFEIGKDRADLSMRERFSSTPARFIAAAIKLLQLLLIVFFADCRPLRSCLQFSALALAPGTSRAP
jgi:hypothetical protein